MRVNIAPQWKNPVRWYWDSVEGKNIRDRGMSIWAMLEQDYNAIKAYQDPAGGQCAIFPDEATYAFFLLRWS